MGADAPAFKPKERHMAAWSFGAWLTKKEVKKLVAKAQRRRRVSVLNDIRCCMQFDLPALMTRTCVLPRLLLQDSLMFQTCVFQNVLRVWCFSRLRYGPKFAARTTVGCPDFLKSLDDRRVLVGSL